MLSLCVIRSRTAPTSSRRSRAVLGRRWKPPLQSPFGRRKYHETNHGNKTFGRPQSFVAGDPTDSYLQFMVKDSKKYAATGGWGFAQFDKDGKPADEAKHKTCFPCHEPAKARDFVFTRYAP